MAYSRTSRTSRQDSQPIPGLNSSRRSWTDPSGTHFEVQTTSYVSPGFSFALNGGNTSFAPPRVGGSSTARGSLAGGLLGGALGLLDGMMSLQRQRQAQRAINGSTRQPVLSVHEEESEESDSNTSFEEVSDHDYDTSARKTVFGKLKTRLRNGTPQQNGGNTGRQQYARTRGRQDEKPQMRAREVSVSSVDSGASSHSAFFRQQANEMAEINLALAELKQSVERQKQSYLRAKSRFQQASQRTMINSYYMQDLLDQMRSREQSYIRGTHRLNELKLIARETAARSPLRTRVRESVPEPRPRAQPEIYTQQVPLPHGFASFRRPQTADIDPLFQAFQSFGSFGGFGQPSVFDRMFEQMEADLGARSNTNGFYFTSSNSGLPKQPTFTSTRPTYASPGPSPVPSYTTYNVAPDPPPVQTFPNALRPDEAVKLYETYNNRWRALAPTDANVPYPTRSLKAAPLQDLTTIPHPTALDWSLEQVMQANTQLFFLLAFKLQPTILTNGIIQVDRSRAKEADLMALKAALKKEKMRWHSDTLGRRNGGGTLVNEGLQKDEKARAVFHGVCGLMETVNGMT